MQGHSPGIFLGETKTMCWISSFSLKPIAIILTNLNVLVKPGCHRLPFGYIPAMHSGYEAWMPKQYLRIKKNFVVTCHTKPKGAGSIS